MSDKCCVYSQLWTPTRNLNLFIKAAPHSESLSRRNYKMSQFGGCLLLSVSGITSHYRLSKTFRLQVLLVILYGYKTWLGSRCSVMIKALCYKPEGGGSRLDEVNEFFQFTWSVCCLAKVIIRSRKIMFLGSRARKVLKADNRATICEPTV
jgi:hypothetical protein